MIEEVDFTVAGSFGDCGPVFLAFTGCCRFFLPGFYWVLLGTTGFYWVLMGFTGFYWGFNGLLYWGLLGFIGF